MRQQLEEILAGKRLGVEEARLLMHSALGDEASAAQLAGLLAALRLRGVTADELDGFSQALMELATPVDLAGHEVMDLCGTGGDGRGSFNISTAAAFVVAGAGHKVAKHGNAAVSSACGSSNVLEALGVRLSSDVDTLRRSLEAANVCFLHAPLFHPALKKAAPVRKELGVRTVFNILGPLVNPARPSLQVSGVYGREVLRLYSVVLSRRPGDFAALVSADGHDEVTLAAAALVATRSGLRELRPEDFGLEPVEQSDLRGADTVADAAKILRSILAGEGTRAQQDVVAANAGLAIHCREQGSSLLDGVAKARESIRSGRAMASLKACVEIG